MTRPTRLFVRQAVVAVTNWPSTDVLALCKATTKLRRRAPTSTKETACCWRTVLPTDARAVFFNIHLTERPRLASGRPHAVVLRGLGEAVGPAYYGTGTRSFSSKINQPGPLPSQKAPEAPTPAWVAQFPESLRFNLTDPLSGQGKDLSNFF